jgi:hypothetical protein
MQEGLAYVRTHRSIREVMVVVLVTQTLARGMLELLPAFADSVFSRGSLGLAHLTTASGMGAILGSLSVSRLTPLSLSRVTRYSAYAIGPLTTLFSLCRTYPSGLALCGLLTLAIVLCSIGLQVELQSNIEDSYRGRVMGLWTTVNTATPGIGGALIGALANACGLQFVCAATGIVCLILMIAVRPRPPIVAPSP